MVQPPAYSAPQPASPTARGRRRWITVVTVLILVAAAAGGGYLLGRNSAADSDTAGSGVGAPYGPARMSDGVPSGYTRNRGGAANAAVNAVQASLLVQANKLPAKAVVARLAAPSIDSASKARLATVDGAALTNPATSLAFPLLVQTDQVSTVAATEKVFFTEIDYGEGTKGSQTGLVQYFFATVGMVWSEGDWKVAKLSTRYTAPGPAGLSAITQPGTQRFQPWRGTQFILLAS